MTGPERYLLGIKPYDKEKYELVLRIEQAQKDAWNEAVKECAENADIKCLKKSQYGKYRKWQNVKEDEEVDLFSYQHQTLVDKQSILKLLKE